MSHPVNDEILERLYDEVKAEYPNDNIYAITREVMRRFEELG